MKLTGPLYAAVDAGPAHQGGFGHSGNGRDMTVSASVSHVRPGGELRIDTSDEPSWDGAYDLWRLVVDWTHHALRPERIEFPLVLTADKWEREVPVDGISVQFLFVGGDETWCALGRPGGRNVSVSGTGWPHGALALVTVDVRHVSAEIPDRP